MQRRILSVAPAVSFPARKVVSFGGDQWICGAHQDDQFQGRAVRVNYVIHRASGLAAIQTPGQVLSSGGTTAYAARMWVKDAKEIAESSRLEGFFNLFLAPTEVAVEGTYITLGGLLHRVRNSFISVAGFLEAESSEIPAGVVSGTYKARTGYNAATDTETLSSAAVSVIRIRWQDSFAYGNKGAEKYEPGDLKALVRKAVITAAAPGDHIQLADGIWSVLAVETESDCWGLHLRRV